MGLDLLWAARLACAKRPTWMDGGCTMLDTAIRMINVEPFHKNLGDMLLATERCLQLQQHLPALVLIYSLVDSLAWAAAGDAQLSVRRRYESWVSRWLLPELVPFAPTVSAIDLYAARCAVLHTLTGDSDLSNAGQAKRFMYAWGTAKAEVLEAVIQEAKQSSYVALHYDALLTSLVRATGRFLESANNDPALRARLEFAAAKHYINIDATNATHEPSP